jgi:HAD superfamily phosphoserine phosphatase-like hydrolase
MNHKLALIDWDNTARPGWTIRDWALYLENLTLVKPRTSSNVEAIIEQYNNGRLPYAEMAEQVLQALADGLRGQSAALIADQARSFIDHDKAELFPFARNLFSALTDRGVSLVVISGAPEEVLNAAAMRYGLDDIHGTTFEVRDGHYAGTIKVNRASRVGKRNAVVALVGESPASIAIGDSEADLPLLENSKLSLVVDNPELASMVPNSLLIKPYDSDISAILAAVDME